MSEPILELIPRIILHILALELPMDDDNFDLDRILTDKLETRYNALTT